MKSIVTVCLALFAICSALPTLRPSISTRQTDLEAETDMLLFSDTMDQFQAARNTKDPSELDWSSDGCTDSPDKPLGFNFLPSCQRHDFGYRNFKAQNRFTDSNKDEIDSNFKIDLYNQCAKGNIFEEAACKGLADLYYDAVHAFGSKRSIDEGLEQ